MRLEKTAITSVSCVHCAASCVVEIKIDNRDPVPGDVVRILEGVHRGKLGTVEGNSIVENAFRVKPEQSIFVFPYKKNEIVILPDALQIASATLVVKADQEGWRKVSGSWTCARCQGALVSEN